MTYTVLWTPSAERALADLWVATGNRSAVRAAADAIDSVLRSTPYQVGESRAANMRILFASPLAVEYAVFEADRVVEVRGVWQVRRR